MNPDEYQRRIRELSGPRPLHRVTDNVSKPRIWNDNVGTISFETQSADRIMGIGKDRNTACVRLIQYRDYLYASTISFIELRYVEGCGY